MIKKLIRSLLINAFAIYLASQAIGGLHLNENLRSLVIVSIAFTTIHIFVKPIVNLFLGPLNFITFGLISLAVDVVILYGLSIFLPYISFSPWQFNGFSSYNIIIPSYYFNPVGSTIISAILINLARSFLNYLSS